MNPLDKSTAVLEIFILLFIAFLIGYFFARWFYLRKNKNNSCNSCNSQQKQNTDTPKIQTIFRTPTENTQMVKQPEPEISQEMDTQIVASPVIDNSALNFNRFGKANSSEKDDLKIISGVGPFIEKKLNSIGIYTFSQISKFTKEDIDTVTDLIEFFPGRIERDDWVSQAKKILENKK